ncbi:MAG: hypothetical protein A2046_10735 [Bacteroidetes bacterium GWA2_30_7]|nr:MAG: hypothetical protein A2046_10735 [Bacteroidetes bacterium GWA2_30_7]
METKKENKCCCGGDDSNNNSSCCDTSSKKSGITGKIIFFAVLGIAIFLIVYKLFIASPETQANNSKADGSCCPDKEKVDCAKEQTPACAGESKESSKPCCPSKEVTHE